MHKYNNYIQNISKYNRKGFSIVNGKLFHKDRQVILVSNTFEIIDEFHKSNGHAKERQIANDIEKKIYRINRFMIRQ